MELLTINLLGSKFEWSHFFQDCWYHQKSISGLWNLHQSHDQGHDHVWIWDFWGGFTLPSPTAIGCLRHTRRKTKSKTQIWANFFFKKQVLQDYWLFGKIAWTCTLQSKESPFLEILHYIVGNKQELESQRRAVKASRYFNILINGEISFILI